MTRVKRGVASHKRHKKLRSQTKGYSKMAQSRIKWAKNFIAKAGQNAYRSRKLKKRDMRSLWIIRINAACKLNDINYSKLINGLLKAKVAIDRKILAELAVNNTEVFKKLIETAKQV